MLLRVFFFFFQAEDGIRDWSVTGVQTCALPISVVLLVLCFYPKDNTPGCTTEGAQFRDLYPRCRKAGCAVYGVSRDSLKSHENFKVKMSFPFDLLSDADEAVCGRFGVIKMKNLYGKKVRGIERSTFVIDRERVIRREWRGVQMPGHLHEVLDIVE